VAACFELVLAHGRRRGRLALCVIHNPELHDRADRVLRLDGGRLEPR
jgi:predicted ABC-type transport system involved in lysophospholipase L1 biosynthesis ATPase subunit